MVNNKQLVAALIFVSSLLPVHAATWDGPALCAAGMKDVTHQSSDRFLNRQLEEAIVRRDHDEALSLMQEGAEPGPHLRDIDFVRVVSNESGLLDAAQRNDVAGIERALANGANPDVSRPADTTWTALMIASYCGYASVASFLLEHGADVNAKKSGALYNAIYANNLSIARLLLERGANPNFGVVDKKGYTPLMVVGSPDVACLLLQYGADPNVIDPNGDTALSAALDKPDIVKILIGSGADVSLKFYKGISVLGSVEKIPDPIVRQIILEHKKYENSNKCRPPLKEQRIQGAAP